MTTEDIKKNGNILGGAWRLPDGTLIGNVPHKDANWCDKDIPKYVEKVVTLSWHSAVPRNVVACPVCKDICEVMHSGYKVIPWYKRLIMPYYRWKYRNK